MARNEGCGRIILVMNDEKQTYSCRCLGPTDMVVNGSQGEGVGDRIRTSSGTRNSSIT